MPDYDWKAINAVFYARPDKLQKLIDKGQFRLGLLENIGRLNSPFPIWRITQCWEAAMGDDASKFTDEKNVADFMARNKKVKEIFKDSFNVEFSPINYQSYWDCFFSNDPNEPDSKIIDPEKAKALSEYGTTELDVALYCATVKFDFQRVKDLLEKGANPRARMYMDFHSDEGAYDRICSECSYLCTCRLSYVWDSKNEPALDNYQIEDLVGWAAHETMKRVMEDYIIVFESSTPKHTRNIERLRTVKIKGASSKVYLDSNMYCIPARKQEIGRMVSKMEILTGDDFFIEFEGPEFGWFEIYFKIKGRKPFLIESSDVYPPFRALRKWMEDMLNRWEYPSGSINIDCECFNVFLSYDFVGFDDKENYVLIQLGHNINEEDRMGDYEPLIQMVVPIDLFVSKLYYSLKDYIYANRKIFSRNWRLPHSDSFEFRKFIRSVESKTIEQKLEEVEKRRKLQEKNNKDEQ